MSGLVGVDIGSSSIRVAQVDGLNSDGFAVVSRLAVVPLREGSVIDGRIKNPQLVANALKRAISEAQVNKYGLVLGMSTPDSAVGAYELPDVIKPAERIKVVRASQQEISASIPLSEAALSLHLTGHKLSKEGNRINSLLAAVVLQKEVQDFKRVCRISGITPRAFDLSGAALSRSLVRDSPSSNTVTTIIDIGSTKTTIVTRQGLHLRSVRTVSGGGLDLTKAVRSATDETYEKAEQRKMSMRVGSRGISGIVDLQETYLDDGEEPSADLLMQTRVEEYLNRAVDSLVEQIALSIATDSDKFSLATQGISLCGGTALLRGLKEKISKRTGVPVQIGRPWAVIQKNKRNTKYFINGVEDPKLMISLATAVGLALWKESA